MSVNYAAAVLQNDSVVLVYMENNFVQIPSAMFNTWKSQCSQPIVAETCFPYRVDLQFEMLLHGSKFYLDNAWKNDMLAVYNWKKKRTGIMTEYERVVALHEHTHSLLRKKRAGSDAPVQVADHDKAEHE